MITVFFVFFFVLTVALRTGWVVPPPLPAFFFPPSLKRSAAGVTCVLIETEILPCINAHVSDQLDWDFWHEYFEGNCYQMEIIL